MTPPILTPAQIETIRQRWQGYGAMGAVGATVTTLCDSHATLTAALAQAEGERDAAYESRAHWCGEAGKAMQERDEARAAADVQFHAYCDAELQTVCIPCFKVVCQPCIEQRGTAGDGQPCRCSHAGHYAMGLEYVTKQLADALAEHDTLRATVAAQAAQLAGLREALEQVADEAQTLVRFWEDTAPMSASKAEWIEQTARAAFQAATPREGAEG